MSLNVRDLLLSQPSFWFPRKWMDPSVDHHLEACWPKWINVETAVCTSGLCFCYSPVALFMTPSLVAMGHQWVYVNPWFSQPKNGYNNLCAALGIAGVEMEKVEMAPESMLSGYQQIAHNISGSQISRAGVFHWLSPCKHPQTGNASGTLLVIRRLDEGYSLCGEWYDHELWAPGDLAWCWYPWSSWVRPGSLCA